MKKILTLALLSIALAVSARAVTVGATAGYLVDGQSGYYTARIAHEFKSASSVAHFGSSAFPRSLPPGLRVAAV